MARPQQDTDDEALLRRCLAQKQHEWWQRWRWPAVLLIAAVWLPVLLLAIATCWNVLNALAFEHAGGGCGAPTRPWLTSPGDYWEAALSLQAWGSLLAVFGVGAAAIHQGRCLSIPSDLVLTHSNYGLYRIVRLATIRICVFWTLLLPILPLVTFELLNMVPSLLPTTAFACIHSWAVHGPILIAWGIISLLLATLIQFLALRYRAKPFGWLLPAYSALAVGILALWFGAMVIAAVLVYQLITLMMNLLMLTASCFLWRATLHPPYDFIEAITEQPR